MGEKHPQGAEVVALAVQEGRAEERQIECC